MELYNMTINCFNHTETGLLYSDVYVKYLTNLNIYMAPREKKTFCQLIEVLKTKQKLL